MYLGITVKLWTLVQHDGQMKGLKFYTSNIMHQTVAKQKA